MKSAIGKCLAFGLFVASAARALAAPPAGIEWQTDLERAVALAQKTKKPLLIQFTATWCGHCQRMKQETFSDPKVIATVNGCFIPVMLDADQNPALLEALKIGGLPTTVVVTLETHEAERFAGFRTMAQLQQDLNKFCQKPQPPIPPVP